MLPDAAQNVTLPRKQGETVPTARARPSRLQAFLCFS